MIAEGTDAGVFHAAEREMLEGVIRFADRPLRASWCRGTDGLAQRRRPARGCLAEVLASGHSRFPLCGGPIDEVIGFVHVKDLLDCSCSGGARPARGGARAALRQREHPGARMIELFRTSGMHMAMVVDEYGSLEGSPRRPTS